MYHFLYNNTVFFKSQKQEDVLWLKQADKRLVQNLLAVKKLVGVRRKIEVFFHHLCICSSILVYYKIFTISIVQFFELLKKCMNLKCHFEGT